MDLRSSEGCYATRKQALEGDSNETIGRFHASVCCIFELRVLRHILTGVEDDRSAWLVLSSSLVLIPTLKR
jgi:hypothetical protein